MTRSVGRSYNPDGVPPWVPTTWIRRGRVDDGDYVDTFENTMSYELNILQRIFVTLEYPNSSRASQVYAWAHTLIIIACVLVSYLSSVGAYQYTPSSCANPACDNDATLCANTVICEPEAISSLWTVDIACYVFYSIDIGVRVLLSPFIPSRVLGIISHHWDKVEAEKSEHLRREEPDYAWYEKSLRYLFTFNNIIDLIATMPYFVELCIASALNNTSANSAIIVTTVRLGRCVRLLKLMDIHPEGSPRLNIIMKSLMHSAPSLILLVGLVLISAVVFGSLIYTAEHGKFMVNSDYPAGEWLREGLDGNLEETPYRNLGTCFYWAVVTMTTLGYGDLYPTSTLGRFIGGFCCIYGIICVALPVTVVNNAFSNELETYKSALKLSRKFRSHNLAHRSNGKQQTLSHFNDMADHELHTPVELPDSLVKKSKLRNDGGIFTVPVESDETRATHAQQDGAGGKEKGGSDELFCGSGGEIEATSSLLPPTAAIAARHADGGTNKSQQIAPKKSPSPDPATGTGTGQKDESGGAAAAAAAVSSSPSPSSSGQQQEQQPRESAVDATASHHRLGANGDGDDDVGGGERDRQSHLASVVPMMFREANHMHVLAKEISHMRTTLGHLEEAFELLCHSDGGGKTHREDD